MEFVQLFNMVKQVVNWVDKEVIVMKFVVYFIVNNFDVIVWFQVGVNCVGEIQLVNYFGQLKDFNDFIVIFFVDC